jgi:cobalt-zinc-cadmium efflux system outer membrane protein
VTKLTLDQVINAVLVSDPKLRAGFEAINQANADALTAALPPNPSLYTDIQLLPLTRPFTVTDQGGPPQYDLQVTQPIDWYLFGKRAANMAVAALGVRVSEADFEDQVRQRVTDAALTFYDVLEAKALLDLAGRDVDNLRQVRDAVARVVPLGKPQIDLNRVELDLLRARQARRDAETTLVTAKAKLRAMIGRTDADPEFDVEGSLDAVLTATLPPPDEGFELAVRNRPDIESDRRKIARAGADVTAQRRAAYPPVSPMFGYTHQFQKKAIGFPDADSWTAALTVGLPLWDRNQGNRLRAASVLVQNQFALAADLAELRAEVETTAQEFRAAKANAESIGAEHLKLAAEVQASVARAYQAGGQTFLDFLDAERNFRETTRAYITSRAAYWRAVYRYRAAIGQQTPR